MATHKRILIAGGGIAGPSCALFLSRAGHQVTIVERAPQLRATGQQIDVAGNGVPIVKKMGIWEALKERTVGDEGLRVVTQNDQSWADFPASKESSASSFVKEIEILRGDMVDVIYQRTKDNTEYIFGDQISALTDHGSHVTASFEHHADRDFDVVVAADGLYSHTRSLVFGKDSAHIRSLNQCVALMSIPWQKSDTTWSRWCNAPGGRCACTRPRAKQGLTGAYLALMTEESGKIGRLPIEKQKQEFARHFADMGWETPRILEEMMRADDFYVTPVAQAKAESWMKGRVALLGDSGYAPSPVSGQGTTLALVGAYILAGCINTYDDVQEALIQYQQQLKPFVEKGQKLYPGVPGSANPQTAWGIRTFYSIMWIASLINSSGILDTLSALLGPLSGLFSSELQLPEYKL
ncbi:hypothetical protein D0862_06646 [Hortaea werneckii]|uniref:FAD-binding domain-containing protein n=1 Tax=Hortaea werneckii TaxID=91943 RepID=A0A3M7GHQ7_HORWE|nr:hypothetical protein D0862_06646 [Hortaea werneckii]